MITMIFDNLIFLNVNIIDGKNSIDVVPLNFISKELGFYQQVKQNS